MPAKFTQEKPAIDPVGFANSSPLQSECSYSDIHDTKTEKSLTSVTDAWIFLKRASFHNPFSLLQSQRLNSLLKKFFFVWAPWISFLPNPPTRTHFFIRVNSLFFFFFWNGGGREPEAPRFRSFIFMQAATLNSLALFRQSLRGLSQH